MSDGGVWQGSGGETPRADWYPDPGGSGGERYWDGERWTDQTRLGGGFTSPPPSPSSAFGQPSPPYAPQPGPFQQPPPYAPAVPVSAKSPAVAVLLTVLWLGAGHFYAGRSDVTAILLAVGNAVLWMLTLACFIGILGWVPLVIWGSIDAARSASEFNRRHNVARPT
jgi:TM2 domain-containing membrane protein YozV